jgi:predicted PhzF superfamily epimerase YddE/YHI9
MGGQPKDFYQATINCYAIFETEDQVRGLQPNYPQLLDVMRGTDIIGYVPTALADPNSPFDIVSRYLAPEEGLSMTEDPVTGSIHSALIPYWASKLGKTKIYAHQASERGGELFCEYDEINNRVKMAWGVRPYLEGFITV